MTVTQDELGTHLDWEHGDHAEDDRLVLEQHGEGLPALAPVRARAAQLGGSVAPGNLVGAVHVAPQTWSDGTFRNLYIRFEDPATLAPEVQERIVYDHCVVAAGLGFGPESLDVAEPMGYRVHQWQATDFGVVGRSSAIGGTKAETPEEGLVWARHCAEEVGNWELPAAALDLYRVVESPRHNPRRPLRRAGRRPVRYRAGRSRGVTHEEQVQWLVDRARISDLLHEFARARHEGLGGVRGDLRRGRCPRAAVGDPGPRRARAFVSRDLGRFHATHHISANHSIEIDGDTPARAPTCWQCTSSTRTTSRASGRRRLVRQRVPAHGRRVAPHAGADRLSGTSVPDRPLKETTRDEPARRLARRPVLDLVRRPIAAAAGVHPRRARRDALVGRRAAASSRIDPDGTQTLVAQEVDTRFAASSSAERYTMSGTLPNGLAFDRNGDILIANFGTDAIERMTRGGASTTIATEIDGRLLGKTNFVLVDSRERIWFTVTTRLEPWTRS